MESLYRSLSAAACCPRGAMGRRFSTLKVRWWLLVLRKTGGWIELEVPAVAVVIGGEV